MNERTLHNSNRVSPIGTVPFGWRVVRIADIATKVGSGATPKGGDKVYLRKRLTHALVRSQHVFDRRFELDGLAYITDADARGLRNAELKPDDILLNITGDGITFGRACIVPEAILPACVNQHVSIIRVDKSQCVPGFLLAYLTHPIVKKYIESFNAGGSRRAITKGHIESFEVPLPTLDIQLRIADILGTLDDKIELNRQMNETLEAMARRLFKSWFVDFDPVHAKAALRREHPRLSNADLSRRALPNMAPEIAELFPDGFEESALGKIPKGWKAGSIGDLAHNSRQGVQPYNIHSTTPYIALEHMPRRCITLSEWSDADSVTSGKFKFNRGEILFGKLRPYFHKVGIAPVNGVCSTDILVIVPNDNYWFSVVMGHVSSDEMIAHADLASTGTKMPRTNWTDIKNFGIAIPTKEIAEFTTNLFVGFVDHIHTTIFESRNLAKTRDRVLPLLLAGELPL
jgi:type I restriction enzyme S subunit